MTDKQNKQEQINRLVKKYPWKDSEELFRAELKQLVEQTRQEAVEEERNWIIKMVKNMNVGVGAVPFVKNLIWKLEKKSLSLQEKQDDR